MQVNYQKIHGENGIMVAPRIDCIINEDTGIASLRGYNDDGFMISFATGVVDFRYSDLS